MEWAQAVMAALLVEALWESLKMLWQAGKLNYDRLGAILLGLAVCVLAKIDFFTTVGVSIPPPFGYIASGILVSRGANFFHDLIKKVETVNE